MLLFVYLAETAGVVTLTQTILTGGPSMKKIARASPYPRNTRAHTHTHTHTHTDQTEISQCASSEV